MTTVEIDYRTYVPFGWFAFEYCSVEFYGDEGYKFKSEWQKIKKERYDKMESIIASLKNEAEKQKRTINDLKEQYEKLPKALYIFKTKKHKELQAKIDRLILKYNESKSDIEEKERQVVWPASNLLLQAHRFLKENGFYMTSHTRSGDECSSDLEMWRKR